MMPRKVMVTQYADRSLYAWFQIRWCGASALVRYYFEDAKPMAMRAYYTPFMTSGLYYIIIKGV
jgi:hypothetical protein